VRTTALVKKEVARAIARAVEDKEIGFEPERDVLHNSAISSADCEPLVGQISQGDTAHTRQGDRIKPKSLRVKGMLSWTPAGCNTSQNMYVRVIIASQKTVKVGSQVLSGIDTTHLLKPGFPSSPEVAFGGATRELNYPINTDLFRVYLDKVIMLAPNNVAGGGCEAMPLYSKRWSYTFKKGKLPASFTYDAGNGDWANNFAPFVAIGYVYPDGTTGDSITTKLYSTIFSSLTYEDA